MDDPRKPKYKRRNHRQFDDISDRELREERKIQELGGTSTRCNVCETDTPRAALSLIGGFPICYECLCLIEGRPVTEPHHLAGPHNDPFTVPLPGNIHRDVSDRQIDWGPRILRNPDGSPLVTATAEILGLLDTLDALSDHVRKQVPGSLDELDQAFESEYGRFWWMRLPQGQKHKDDEE